MVIYTFNDGVDMVSTVTPIDECQWADLTPEAFLQTYWQKKPVLLRQALPSFQTEHGLNHFIDADELAGLACEDGVESRVIVEQGLPPQHTPWQVMNGPLSPEAFTQLPETQWTLLVQDVEKHIPELADVFDTFRFIPSWRLDDLMISYAEDGGSVGAHVDAYDVFLLQAHGQRRWQIAEAFDPAYRDDVELRILQDFVAEAESLLEPGDMLYLPPDVAHHGVAQGSCMTWSIGFRAPSLADMANDYADHVIQQLDETKRYADPELQATTQPAAIGTTTVAKLAAMHQQLFTADAAQLVDWWGGLVTSPKPWLLCSALDVPYTPDEIPALLAGQSLYRDTRTLLVYHVDDGVDNLDQVAVFVNGQRMPLPIDVPADVPAGAPGKQSDVDWVQVLTALTGPRKIAAADVAYCLSHPAALALLTTLINQGCYYADDA